MVTLPSYEGDMSILKDHISIITFLRPGVIIVKKKDGRIKKLSQRLVYDTDRIYFRPAYNEDKYYINRKTLELNTPTGRSIGQCKVLTNADNIKEELELILKSNTSNNLL